MWGAVLLTAVAVFGFGLLAYFWLETSLPSLATLFAAYAAVDGAISIFGAVRGGGVSARTGLALAGVAGLLAGAAVAFTPAISSSTLATIIGIWAVARGGLEFVNALTLRKYMERDWSLALIGMGSALFGALRIVNPGFQLSTLVWLLCTYSLILGLLLLVLARRFRRGLQP